MMLNEQEATDEGHGDEDQKTKLEECFVLLIAAGYFRARIVGLSDFDKLIGGFVWCIQLCRLQLNVDLFYKDSLSIGKKIALTERIIAVLKSMKCPHTIEPHQIQGCDAANVFPVLQWLVRNALDAQSGSVVHNVRHGQYLFYNMHPNVAQSHPECHDLSRKIKDISEYFQSGSDSAEINELLGATYSEWKSNPSTAIVEVGITYNSDNLSILERLQCIKSKMDKKMALLAEKYESLKILSDERKHSISLLESELQTLREEISFCSSSLSEHDLETIERIRSNLEEANNINKKDQIFKDEAKLENEKLLKEIEAYSDQNENDLSSNEAEDFIGRIKSLNGELSRVWQQILELETEIGDSPNRAEIFHYQKSFVELHNMALKTLQESKNCYATINLLNDTVNYLDRERKIVNSISDQFSIAEQSSETRAQFMDQLDGIVASITSNKKEVDRRLADEQTLLNENQVTLNSLRSLSHTYRQALQRFKQECAINRELTGLV